MTLPGPVRRITVTPQRITTPAPVPPQETPEREPEPVVPEREPEKVPA